MLSGNFLEACQMLPCRRSVTLALISPRQTKFGRSMKRVSTQRLLKRSDGLVVMLGLGLQISDEIKTVCFRGDFRYVLESGNAFFNFA